MNTVEFSVNGWKYVALHDPDNGNIFIQNATSSRSEEEIRIALAEQEKQVAEKESLFKKASKYIKAEASLLLSQPLPLPIIQDRKLACSQCEGCDRRSDEEWYCDKCGCPKWDRSRLQVKWEMPAATCPLGKWPDVG
jgi:hypothetical protein